MREFLEHGNRDEGIGERGYARHIAPFLPLVDAAWLSELLRLNLVSEEDARKIIAYLEFEPTTPEGWVFENGSDPYSARMTRLWEDIGACAGVLETARARRDAVTTAWFMAVREAILHFLLQEIDLLERLLNLAEPNATTPWPDYTYSQYAQPGSLGHFLFSHVEPQSRSLYRIWGEVRNLGLCPLGTGSATGTHIPIDRARIAADLGFDGPFRNSRDAMWPVDVPIAIGGALSSLAVSIERFLEDLLFLTQSDVALLTLSSNDTRSSIIMPQKRNPYVLVTCRMQAKGVLNRASLMSIMALTPSGFPDVRIAAYIEVPQMLADLAHMVRNIGSAVGDAQFERERAIQILNAPAFHLLDEVESQILEGRSSFEAQREARSNWFCSLNGLDGRLEEGGLRSLDSDLTVDQTRQGLVETLWRKRSLGGASPDDVTHACQERLMELRQLRDQIQIRLGTLNRSRMLQEIVSDILDRLS